MSARARRLARRRMRRATRPTWRSGSSSRADAADGVLDVGAGTGRVALRLAQRRPRVTALDLDPELLAVLSERAPREAARSRRSPPTPPTSRSPEPVGLIAVPMQTIQLLARARRLLRQRPPRPRPGRRLAIAIATELEPYDGGAAAPAAGHRRRPTAGRYISPAGRHPRRRRPRRGSSGSASVVGPTGERVTADDLIGLSVVTPGGLAEEAAEHGLEAEELLHIPETDEHVALQVVIFRG